MDNTFNEIKKTIESEFDFFNEFYENEINTDTPIISDVLDFLFSVKGKMLRPIIVLLSAKMHGTISKRTYIGASAIEILHTATLVHDDVVDNADIRRGKSSVQSKWSPKVAVLVGDYLLSKALDIISSNGEYKMLSATTDVVRIISEGELFQLKKTTTRDTTEDEYFEIIYKKTASLICACANVGAISVDADEETAKRMVEFAKNIGLAFQIRDDIFDFDKNSEAGKPYGNDLREQKLTLPLIYAMKRSSKNEQFYIMDKFSKCIENTEFVDEIVDFAILKGGIKYAEKTMQNLCQKAIDLLLEFPESDARNALVLYAKYIATRNK